jgi:hypothetical protein
VVGWGRPRESHSIGPPGGPKERERARRGERREKEEKREREEREGEREREEERKRKERDREALNCAFLCGRDTELCVCKRDCMAQEASEYAHCLSLKTSE